MWFVGLILGAVAGAVFGRGEGLILGAIAGAVIGWFLSRKAAPADDARLATIEDAIRQLNERVKALERRAPQGEASASPVPVPEIPRPLAASATPAATKPEQAEPALAAFPDADAATAAAILRESQTRGDARPAVDAAIATQVAQPADNFIMRWFTGGNTLVRVGVVLLFFGVAFLLKYAAEHGFVPIELRIAGVAAGGIALLFVGWRLRAARAGYALMLQGGGVGILYLTVFAALRLYRLVPPELAFFLLAGIAVFSAILAVTQDSRALAITGAAGGFLAPVLASTGSGNHVALFSFYAVLNAGIVLIAWHKAWRELNLVGFAFTFVIGLAWGAKYYRPGLFASTEPFLVLFFLMYVTIAVLFALREAPRLAHYVDGTLVFGVPIIAFGMQTGLVKGMEFGAAWSALGLAAFYIALAACLYRRGRESLRLLVESFLALGIGFATLAIPLAFDGRLTSAVWAVEGAAIVWVSVRQNRVLGRVFGVLLQFAAGLAFLAGADAPTGGHPVLNSLYIGSVMVGIAGLFCAWYLSRSTAQTGSTEPLAPQVLFCWGALWWFGGGVAELVRHATETFEVALYLLFFSGSCLAFGWIGRRLDWSPARGIALAAAPLAAVVLALIAARVSPLAHPFANHAYVGWIAALAVHLWALRLHETIEPDRHGWLHAFGFWLLAVLLSWEVGWQIDRIVDGRRAWPLIAWAVVPGAMVALLAVRGARLGWPVASHVRDYLYRGALPLVAYLLGWLVFVNFRSDGDPAPLPYVPLLNPLDLAQAAALLAIATWYLQLRRLALDGATLPEPVVALRAIGVVMFIVLNGVLLRTLHHYADVPFDLQAMLRSNLVQAAFSLFWSLLALAAMVTAARRGLRALWIVGAVLLAVVVGKLFLVDLAHTGTVERVVSFIGVGVLIIVIGYFAPVPPRAKEISA